MGPGASFTGALLFGAAVLDEVSQANAAVASFRFVNSCPLGVDIEGLELGTISEVVVGVFTQRARWSLSLARVCEEDGAAHIIFLIAGIFRIGTLAETLQSWFGVWRQLVCPLAEKA